MAEKPQDPFRSLIVVREQLSRLFADDPWGQGAGSAWIPPVNIYESEDRYLLQAEVPGMDADKVHVEIHENQLQICGERELLISPAEKYHLMESPQGKFERSFQFPVPISADKVSARLADGILTVCLPKQRTDGAEKIKID
ncbi:MAG: Hsp20/alpha crystallin family protein [Acidobacteria bacterium]|nr:Hsp20/alpha crystallin family protein [Acidobacteriota bacterium]